MDGMGIETLYEIFLEKLMMVIYGKIMNYCHIKKN